MRTLLGIERLLEERPRTGRVGVLTHGAARLPDGKHTVEALREAGYEVVRLFSPEHGLWGTHQALEPVRLSGADPILHVPVVSLYGGREESLRPDPAALQDLDTVIIDIQDVGARYYTYIWHAALLLRTCAEVGVEAWILDRPNPLGGAIEGPMLKPEYRSFVGLYPVPTRHGLTVWEMVRYLLAFHGEDFRGLRVRGFPLKNWHPAMLWWDTGLPWFPPSPNMPTPRTALVYPGLCLLEGTNVSEGRGTTRPFEYFGAPWLRWEAVPELPGARLLPTLFRPTFHKYAGELCRGFFLHILDTKAWKPVVAGVRILQYLVTQHAGTFRWRPPPYEFERQKLPIDLLLGDPEVRLSLEAGEPLADWEERWEADALYFGKKVREVRVYGTESDQNPPRTAP